MEGTFEILREAGVRLPRLVGPSISFVGALVIGEAAVRAKLVSPIMVIIVALTAIASLTIPSLEVSIAICLIRSPIIFLAGSLGLFGIMAALLAILIHLCTLRSFGVPSLSPLAPLSLGDLKDTFARFPWWAMFARPRMTGYKEPARQDFFQKPRNPPTRKRGMGKVVERVLDPGKISASQLSLLLITLVIATSVLFVPAVTAETAGRDGWMSILFSATAFGLLVAWVCTSLGRRFPRQNIIEYSPKVFGPALGYLTNFSYIFFSSGQAPLLSGNLQTLLQLPF